MTRQEIVDGVAGLAASLEIEGPLSRNVAACLYSLAGAVAAGDPWFREVTTFMENQSRAYLDYQKSQEEAEHAN